MGCVCVCVCARARACARYPVYCLGCLAASAGLQPLDASTTLSLSVTTKNFSRHCHMYPGGKINHVKGGRGEPGGQGWQEVGMVRRKERRKEGLDYLMRGKEGQEDRKGRKGRLH